MKFNRILYEKCYTRNLPLLYTAIAYKEIKCAVNKKVEVVRKNNFVKLLGIVKQKNK